MIHIHPIKEISEVKLNTKIKSICTLNNQFLLYNYRKPHFIKQDKDFKLLHMVDYLCDPNDKNNINSSASSNLNLNVIALTSNGLDAIYIITTNNLYKFDANFEYQKQLFNHQTYKFNYLCSISYSNYNKCVYVCDCYNQKLHKLCHELNYLSDQKFDYDPIKVETLNNTILILPQYYACELKCFNFYDLDTYELKYRFSFSHYGPIGVYKNDYFIYYEHVGESLYFIHYNGYLIDKIDLKLSVFINKMSIKFNLSDQLIYFNQKFYLASSINEKIFCF